MQSYTLRAVQHRDATFLAPSLLWNHQSSGAHNGSRPTFYVSVRLKFFIAFEGEFCPAHRTSDFDRLLTSEEVAVAGQTLALNSI